MCALSIPLYDTGSAISSFICLWLQTLIKRNCSYNVCSRIGFKQSILIDPSPSLVWHYTQIVTANILQHIVVWMQSMSWGKKNIKSLDLCIMLFAVGSTQWQMNEFRYNAIQWSNSLFFFFFPRDLIIAGELHLEINNYSFRRYSTLLSSLRDNEQN